MFSFAISPKFLAVMYTEPEYILFTEQDRTKVYVALVSIHFESFFFRNGLPRRHSFDFTNLDKHFPDLLEIETALFLYRDSLKSRPPCFISRQSEIETALFYIETALPEIEGALPEIQIHTRTQSRFPAGWSRFVAGLSRFQAGWSRFLAGWEIKKVALKLTAAWNSNQCQSHA